ncbi:gliding motility protein [Streptomyces sp. NPDC008122]|uniref:gliding motility protein n=1 Tax=Streptomyces sp. NPDC008122 TaxID=3364810 RepID=UPI0036EDA79D
MGVFAMFRRKKQETSPEETGTDTGADVAAEALTAPAGDRADGAGDVEVVVEAAVEIPKQQSVEAAADNEAGDGARR